jgi:hypothetical protein
MKYYIYMQRVFLLLGFGVSVKRLALTEGPMWLNVILLSVIATGLIFANVNNKREIE